MKVRVKYFNKPHDLRLIHPHIVPMGKGIWYVHCGISHRGYDISSTGSSQVGKFNSTIRIVYFGDADCSPLLDTVLDQIPDRLPTLIGLDPSLDVEIERRIRPNRDRDLDRAALIFIPESKEEENITLTCHNIYKTTYHAVMISRGTYSRKWDEYCKKRG